MFPLHLLLVAAMMVKQSASLSSLGNGNLRNGKKTNNKSVMMEKLALLCKHQPSIEPCKRRVQRNDIIKRIYDIGTHQDQIRSPSQRNQVYKIIFSQNPGNVKMTQNQVINDAEQYLSGGNKVNPIEGNFEHPIKEVVSGPRIHAAGTIFRDYIYDIPQEHATIFARDVDGEETGGGVREDVAAYDYGDVFDEVFDE